MKHTRFEYEVKVTISFTGREIKALRKWSQNHYDSVCKAACGDGFLNDLANRWIWEHDADKPSVGVAGYEDSNPILDKTVETTLSRYDLGTLAKIAEAENSYCLIGDTPLHGGYGRQIAGIMKEANEEWQRLERNADCLT